ncbi:hypothetical protein DL768_001519 [Monosporascus sp. mg162]|nr:hypothetical protein DL768_001519 [Monosporascus sp. mg162]
MAEPSKPEPGHPMTNTDSRPVSTPPGSDNTLVSDADVGVEAGATKEQEATGTDPNVVDWDGPDDPENPMNWSDTKKWLNIAVLSILTLVT